MGLKERVVATSGGEREPLINDLKWGGGSGLVQNQDVGDEQIGVMIDLKCRGWIEMLVVSSRKLSFHCGCSIAACCGFGVEGSHGVLLS